jgi:hypothetical protein
MFQRFNSFLGDLYVRVTQREEGQAVTEYALVLAVIVAGATVALLVLFPTSATSGIGAKFTAILNKITP